MLRIVELMYELDDDIRFYVELGTITKEDYKRIVGVEYVKA
ncbi:MAG TPA: XkdX family protein [Staphylococcus ureilyticus]|nr:XkdX family protein [Staphylococcus ureilyticus]HJG66634.1 XkdX family protein [Staphylococcus ureilyticus]